MLGTQRWWYQWGRAYKQIVLSSLDIDPQYKKHILENLLY